MSDFKVSLSGKKATVLRSYTFPKTGPLPDLPLKLSYEVKLSLAGLDEKSPAAKKILGGFPKSYEAALQKAVKPRAQKNRAIWSAAAKALDSGKDPAKVAMDTKKLIVANWNEFDQKIAKPLVNEVLDQLVLDEIGKMEAKTVKASATFRSEPLKDDRLKVLTGLAGVASGAAATAAAASAALVVAPFIATAAAIVGTMAAARKLSEKTYSEMGIVRKRVDKELAAVSKSLSALEPQMKTLEQQKQKLGLLMIKSEANLRQLQAELKKLKTGDLKDLALEKQGKELEKKINGAQKKLIDERSRREGIILDLKGVRALVEQAKRVSDDFEAGRTFYDKGLAAFEGSSTEMSAANKILATFTNAIKPFA